MKPHAADVNLHAGTAALESRNQDVEDYGNLLNALEKGPSLPAEVTYAIRWGDVSERLQIHDPDIGYEGDFVVTAADIVWSARQEGFTFVSDPLGTAATVFAMIGAERNGVFFS
jgi:hypothetical protein